MWVFTSSGFYSIVEDKDDNNLLHVRARDREDLVRFGAAPILETLQADYPYRVIIPRAMVTQRIAQFTEDINYRNFKDAVTEKQGQTRHNLYMRVWAIMRGLEWARIPFTEIIVAESGKKRKKRGRRRG